MCHTSLQVIYTHHFPDKWAGYDGGKLISKQTSMKASNLGATTKR